MRLLGVFLLSSALARCGGGGGGGSEPPPSSGTGSGGVTQRDVIDKYVGTFPYMRCSPSASQYAAADVSLVKTGGSSANYSVQTRYYNGSQCTGSAVRTTSETGTVTCSGTKLIGAETFDKCILSGATGSAKQIFAIRASGAELAIGDLFVDLDAEGYPTVVSTAPLGFRYSRIVSFGDAMSDLGQSGARYTVNDGTINTWLEQVASRFSLPLKATSAGGTAYGRASARITLKPDAAGNAATPTVTEQIDAFLATKTINDTDLIILGGGVADVIAEVRAVIAGTQTEDQAIARLQTTAKELGAQARRLVTAGARHVVVVGAYNLGITPYATTANRVSTLLNASSRYNEAFLVSAVDLGATVLYVDAAYYFNLVATVPGEFSLSNSTAIACTSVDPGAGIGIGAGQVNSSLCTASSIASGVDYNKRMFADPIYTTPPVQRLFGDYAFDRIRARW